MMVFWFFFGFIPERKGSSLRAMEESIVASALGWRRWMVEVHRVRGNRRKAFRALQTLRRVCRVAESCGFGPQVKKLRKEYFKERREILF